MVVCPDCGKDVKEAKFCSNCGAVLPKVEISDVEEPVEEVVEENIEETPSQEVTNDVEEAIDEGETIEVNNVSEEPDEDVIEVKTVKKNKFCTNCGAEIVADTAFCPQCGFKFHQEETQTKFCQSCGKKININAEICPHCGVRVAGVAVSEEKNVLLAAILSFLFPGLGHLYNGLTKKGVSFIIAYIVSCILIFLLIGIILVIIVWIWALIDAIKTTEAINRGEAVEDKLF